MNHNQKSKLWEEYAKYRTSKVREKLILEYAELVKIVAGRVSMYLGTNVEYDDLLGYGSIGLIDAIDKFDYTKGVKFETYASFRIRGSMIDEIRKLDWAPRTLRNKQKKLREGIAKIERDSGTVATDEEIASYIGISKEELLDWYKQIEQSNIASLDEYMEAGGADIFQSDGSSGYETPEKFMERQELKTALAKTIESLTKREKEVITLYYFEELTLKEISYILKVTESRVSQLHTRALEKMKEKLGNSVKGLFEKNI